jgi:hypothetical protein
MSLLELHHDSALTAHEAPSGEDYAKGSSYLLWATLAAFVAVSVGITLFLLANRKPPVSAGEVTQVWVHAVHTLNTPMDANGVQTAGTPFDQVLVFAKLRVRNQSNQPIVLREMLTNVTLDDGAHSSYAATATDYSRIFLAYPELAGLRDKTLVRDTVIQPGEVLDGMIVSAFHASKEQWDAHKDLSFTLEFKFHPDLVLTPTAQQVIAQ